jgi:hypothetical protein
MHPLVRELVALLPSDGDAFPEPARKRWVVAIEAAFELLYGDGDDGQPPAQARHRALPATDTDRGDSRPPDYSEDRDPAEYGLRYPADYPAGYATEYDTGPTGYATDYSNGSAEHPGEYRAERTDSGADADDDDASWRRRGDLAVGSTYSSYTWDTSSP